MNLADASTGVARVLPILVQRALDVLDPPRRPVLEIVEQPELHLHPAAHAALADLYLRTAATTRVRFLVETHRETLLLRLRRRIAEVNATLPWSRSTLSTTTRVWATARRIQVSDDGGLDYWPAGVFSEDYAATRALASAQMQGWTR